MKFFAIFGAGPQTTIRKQKRFASLAILFTLLALALGCGITGGGGADEEEITGSDQTIDSENLKDISASSGAGGEEIEAGEATEADAEPEAEAIAEPEPEAEPAAAEEPTTTEATDEAAEAVVETEAEAESAAAAAGVLVQGAELARNLAWVHLSQCVSLKSIELAATFIKSDWFIASSAEATRAYSFWKVDAASGAVTPHDTLSLKWQATFDLQCSTESMEAVATLARLETPVIADAADAVATVWSFLSRCFPNLEKEIFEATHDPALGEWVVVTKTNSAQQFGTWKVAKLTGELKPYAGLAQAWDSTVKLECSAEAMAGLVTPTPFPTPTPAVKDFTEAVTNLWAHLVKCAPAMTVSDWQATWNPANGEWVVVTKPGVTVDYGVWVVRKYGSIIPENREAVRRNTQAGLAAC